MKAPSERHLEDWIVAHPEDFGGEYFDFNLRVRQFPLPSGRLDLLGTDFNTIYVIEIKKDNLKPQTLSQVLRYKKDLHRIWQVSLSGLPHPDPGCTTAAYLGLGYHAPQIKGLMVGYDIEPELVLSADASDVDVFTYEYNPETNWYTFDWAIQPRDFSEFEPYRTGIIGKLMRQAYMSRLAGIYSESDIAGMYQEPGYWNDEEL